MNINKTSASRTNTFLTCSFKYLLQYEVYMCEDCGEPTYVTEMKHFNVDLANKKCMNPQCGGDNVKKLTMPSNWGAKNGTIIHNVLELYARARKGGVDDWRLDWKQNLLDFYSGEILSNPELPNGMRGDSDEEMRQLMASQNDVVSLGDCSNCEYGYCPEWLPSKVCPRKLIVKSVQHVGLAVKRYDDLYTNSCLGIEHNFNIDIGDGVVINGFFDLVLAPDQETIEIVDYKSGKSTKNYDELKNDIQARLYSLAIKHEFPDYKNFFLTFDYFNRSPVTLTFSNAEDEWTRKNVIKWFKMVEANNNPTRIPLNRDGTINYKCRYICNRDICDAQWNIFQKRYGKGGF